MKSLSSHPSVADNDGKGMNFIKLQNEELNIENITKLVNSPDCGAISTFLGVTRDNFEDKKVIKLEYEAYEPMAVKEITEICNEIRSKWDVKHIAIYHRLGEVPVSQASVTIAISSPHRQESLQAVEYAINKLKEKVPIWKKEVYDTEETQWKENKECLWSNTEDEDVDITLNLSVTEEVNSDLSEINTSCIQVRASSDEVKKRIEAFITRTRQQVNAINVQEFCNHSVCTSDEESSCARVDAMLIRRKDSKSHVKVYKVINTWGPQTINQALTQKTTSMAYDVNKSEFPCSSALDERLTANEKILGINKPVPRNVYQRLKNIEDKLLYLEGISPEYKDFLANTDVEDTSRSTKPIRKRTYSTAELDFKLHQLEDRYTRRLK